MKTYQIRGLMVIILATIIGSVNLSADICATNVIVTSEVNPNTCCVDITIENQNSGPGACDNFPVNIYQYDEHGASTLQHAITIDCGESIIVSLCMLDNMNTIEWQAYRDGHPTPFDGKAIEDMSSCCSCSEDRNSWLTFDVEYNNADCGPGQCKVTPIVTIPDDITCYTHYFGLESEDAVFSPTVSIGTPLPSYCIDKGQTIEYYVALAKSANASEDDWNDLCTLEAVSPVCDKPVAEPCVPDCVDDEFLSPPITQKFILSATCPMCTVTVTVTYTFRQACGNYQDLQILEMEYEPGSTCDDCFVEDIYENVAAAIIALSNEAPIGFQPIQLGDCYTQWRITQAGCWAKETLHFILDAQGNIVKEVVNWHPCACDVDDCGCCLQRLNVCRTGYRTVDITPIGNTINQGTCSGSVTGDDNQIHECIPACAWAGQINGSYEAIEAGVGTGASTGKAATDYGSLLHRITYTYIDDVLNIELHTQNAENAIVDIYDLKGNKVGTQTYNVHIGINELSYNTEKLHTGNYIYILTIDGNPLNSDKFTIVR